MSDPLHPGLYEQVITEALAKLLDDDARLRDLDQGAAPASSLASSTTPSSACSVP